MKTIFTFALLNGLQTIKKVKEKIISLISTRLNILIPNFINKSSAHIEVHKFYLIFIMKKKYDQLVTKFFYRLYVPDQCFYYTAIHFLTFHIGLAKEPFALASLNDQFLINFLLNIFAKN
ncbi:hypothetical protein BpHYR1_025066 [Brachionus plicatilis]|uniref:Uncharacterized protein n=1 Tax=Brachionus plicatilis TaxID=10195 RepID=A0A3M7SE81_BRAPC|nr:hypothetical protein BpHYR1_025066 [Brachionus plicatilis]